MRLVRLALTAALATGSLVACGGRQQPSSAVTADDAIFFVATNVADATVFVDGRFVGPVGVLKGGIAVEPGTHRLELRHEDYFSRYVELDLKRAERRTLELPMARILP